MSMFYEINKNSGTFQLHLVNIFFTEKIKLCVYTIQIHWKYNNIICIVYVYETVMWYKQ